VGELAVSITASATERAQFNTCRQQWDFASLNRQGLEPIIPGVPLFLGHLVHFTIEDWFNDPNIDPPAQVREYGERGLTYMRQRYIDVNSVPPVIDAHEEAVDLAEAMMRNYRDYYQTPVPPGFELIATEKQFIVPIPHTGHCVKCGLLIDGPFKMSCVGRSYSEHEWGTHYLEGTLDAVIRNRKTGALWVVDHKTYERLPSSTELAMNDQFLTYQWITTQLVAMGQLEEPAVGTLYNGLWKRAEPTKAKPNFGDLFHREFILRKPEEVEEHGRMLALEVGEMGSPGLPIYLNRAWSTCTYCAFKDACIARSRGEDASWILDNFVKRTKEVPWRYAVAA